jgi:hypothetical protein
MLATNQANSGDDTGCHRCWSISCRCVSDLSAEAGGVQMNSTAIITVVGARPEAIYRAWKACPHLFTKGKAA